MSFPVLPHGFLGAQGDSDTYRIERSLRFNSADSAFLNRTPSSATSRTVWTFSCWVKRSALTSNYTIFSAGTSAITRIAFEANAAGNGDSLRVFDYDGASFNGHKITTALYRDTSSWYHIVVAWNTAEAAADRIKIYVNGSQVTSFSTNTNAGTGSTSVNNNVLHRIGQRSDAASGYFSGYMAEIHLIDGQALTPSSFGETDAITGRWKAKAYSGTYGTNGFYLSFKDNTSTTTLGYDDAGSNDWTLNNFSVTAGAGNDSLVDSPTNYGTDTGLGGEVRGSYATNNPIDNSGGATLSNGNLDVSISGLKSTRSSIAMTSGKWYCEVLVNTVGNTMVGVLNSSASLSQHIGQNANGWGYYHNGNKYTNNVSTAFGNTYTNSDIIGIAYDANARKVWFSKNGVWQASGDPAAGANEAYSSITGSEIFFGGSNGGSATSCSLSFNFGQRPFAYAAPSGFKALCTQNLTQPTIQKPSTAMDVVTYTGTGASQSISSLGFSPDLVWIKGRSGATDHAIYDTTRGVQQDLGSNLTTDETTQSQGVTAFGANGFTIGTLAKLNTNTSTYVAWAWDESAINGLDIVSYTGNGTARTISHNLGVAPKMMIVRNRNSSVAQNWQVYHANLTSAAFRLRLNTTDAQDSVAGIWNSTAPTSSVFSVGTETGVNENGKNFIAYLFAEVEGFSKFGSYTGNGSADGPFVWCGFRPRYILIKCAGTAATNWIIHDTARNDINLSGKRLIASASNAEASDNGIDILSNGFKMRSADGSTNTSTSIHIFAAFAESPFKYARAR